MILLASLLAAADTALSPGHYGAELWVSSATETPIIGEVRGQSVSWLLMTITDEGSTLWQEHTTCSVELLDATGGSRASFADGFVERLPARRYPLRLDEGTYRADIGIEHLGYDPTHPLPTGPDSPGILDWDRDGNPGVTVRINIPLVGTEEMYIAQRAHMRMRGTVHAADRVTGGLEMPILEQNTLGASIRILDRSPPIRPLPGESGFSMTRLPEGVDCSTLKATLCAQDVARPESCARLE